ncbi:PEP/pyruvate-binding domain-containing protein [Actinomycetospora lutea]|uniref:PEP/pyruvate-binding domain-containing protein n=1 Tax=Actinomycetospora lutea TaxID=663604 RepID=UPI002366BB43|nr:PEP/pyruvate-binding domain-containing protein [Actinomycetospora lutea]MDD7942609.1 PEP/pyruvate-binding domain-containing protein [Actinomycetospora lutea]
MEYVRTFAQVTAADVALVGGKGANLGELVRAGLPVPDGVVLTTDAYAVAAAGVDVASPGVQEGFLALTVPDDVAAEVRAAYADLGGGPVAVRSSATAEDLADASFAGQQETLLDVRGEDALLDAVVRCWASLWTPRAVDYRARQRIAPEDVRLAVVIQRMADAEASGVLFTAEPTTGRRDRIVVSAAWGLGESVVGGLAATDELVVDRATFVEVGRTVAAKTEMTVATGGGTAQVAVPAERQREPVLGAAEVGELARLGVRAEEHFGVPQDVEWVRAGGAFALVQARPITALPPPTDPPPSTWPLPYPGGAYFRASIVEQMPSPLTPLFADLIGPAVTDSIGALFAGMLGRPLPAGDIAFPTINGYAYYFYRTRGLLWMTVRLPWALRALNRPGTRGGVRGWRERAHPAYVAVVAEWTAKDLAALSSAELLDGVVTLLDAGATYYTAVQSVIPLAATAEIGFTAFHDRLVRRAGEPAAHVLLVGEDSEPLRAERSLYALAVQARAGGTETEAWRRGFAEHLERYGHTVFDLDFAEPTPADDPGTLLDTIRFQMSEAGVDPEARRSRLRAERDARTEELRARLGPVRRRIFDALLARARALGPAREDALADVGLAWPLMRRMLRELGGRLLGEPDDVFWLTESELRAAIRGEPVDPPIADRKALRRGRALVSPPQMLPEVAWLRTLFGRFMPGAETSAGEQLRGVPGSTGEVTATARVLRGPDDFGAMRPGEVLVARMTTPAWTPLFARAAAVVTDIGGPLSHSSIVAREYGIPAVLGTGAATDRIRTGDQVHVDGDAGTVRVVGP